MSDSRIHCQQNKFLKGVVMSQQEKLNRSSGCLKCGGYVDHIAMACIMCGVDYQPHPPTDHEGEGNTHDSISSRKLSPQSYMDTLSRF